MYDQFISQGFTDIIDINFNEELENLQKLIYLNTKHLLVEHDENLPIEEKINLKFKEVPHSESWSKLMNEINGSIELRELMCSKGIISAFNKIFNNPKFFKISTFRARFPNQKKVLYDWHQDEGTWFLSKDKDVLNKFPATLWFSINGAKLEDSIQLVKFSHKGKLLHHSYVNGQGFFRMDKNKTIDQNKITTIEINSSQAVLFHSLTIHRSIPPTKLNLRPRYSIDIRYYDPDFRPTFKTDIKFSLKKFFRILN